MRREIGELARELDMGGMRESDYSTGGGGGRRVVIGHMTRWWARMFLL